MSDLAVHFCCPVCDARMRTVAEHAGQIVRCSHCHALLEVPQAAGEPQVARAELAPVRFRPQPRRGEPEMDMTPMVDVTFLLLIFFMVTAAFAMQKSFQVPTPDETDPSVRARTVEELEEEGYITVRVDEYNTFHVSAAHWDEEREAPSEHDLLRFLREAKAGDGHGPPPTRMLLVAHGQAMHQRVVTAMDAGTEVGMEDVKLVTQEE